MTNLNREARTLLRQGRDLGEPSDVAVARVRASLMRRVGVATSVVATGTAIGKAATAARASWVAASLVTKIVAVTAVVSAGVAGGYAYQGSAPRSTAAPPARSASGLHAQAAPSRTTPARSAGEETALAAPSASQATEAAEPLVSPPIALAARDAPAPSSAPARPADARPVAVRAEKPSAPVPSLSDDVAALRAAQSALLAGDPQQALDIGAHVQPDGPLGEEREALLLVARCALATPGAVDEARDFARRRAGSPLALRVQRACKLGSEDFDTNRGGSGHP